MKNQITYSRIHGGTARARRSSQVTTNKTLGNTFCQNSCKNLKLNESNLVTTALLAKAQLEHKNEIKFTKNLTTHLKMKWAEIQSNESTTTNNNTTTNHEETDPKNPDLEIKQTHLRCLSSGTGTVSARLMRTIARYHGLKASPLLKKNMPQTTKASDNASKKIGFKFNEPQSAFLKNKNTSAFLNISGRIENTALTTKYTLNRQIGAGAYAVVRLALCKDLNSNVALKIYSKSHLIHPLKQRSVQREISILRKMQNPNIVKFIDSFDTETEVVIVQEYIQGPSLISYIKAHPNHLLTELDSKRIFRQIVSGLKYCHNLNIAHRDIKLENILIESSTSQAKIIDFGFSTCLPPDSKCKLFCGTPSYMAPEIVLQQENTGNPTDIWAIGVLLYFMLCGRFPFKGKTDKELFGKITKVEYKKPDHVSLSASSLLKHIFQKDPAKRPTASQILESTWLAESTKASAHSSRRFPLRNHQRNASENRSKDSKAKIGSDEEVIQCLVRLGYARKEIDYQIKIENSHLAALYRRLLSEKRQNNQMFI